MGVAKKGVPKYVNAKRRVLGGEGLRVWLLGVGVSGRMAGKESVQRKPAVGASPCPGAASPCPCAASPCPWLIITVITPAVLPSVHPSPCTPA